MIMIEKEASVAAMLKQQAQLLDATALSVQHTSAETFLTASLESAGADLCQSFDIVFIDPPFEARLQVPILDQLLSSALLKPGALIYVESPRESGVQTSIRIELPEERLVRLRSKQTGNVVYQLFRKA